jgi:hypothetical protein
VKKGNFQPEVCIKSGAFIYIIKIKLFKNIKLNIDSMVVVNGFSSK